MFSIITWSKEKDSCIRNKAQYFKGRLATELTSYYVLTCNELRETMQMIATL